MLIYIIVILFCFLLAFFKMPRSIENSALALVAFFLCFGYMTGSDWYMYELFYENIEMADLAEQDKESGYFIVQNFFSKLGVDFWVFHIGIKLLVFYSIVFFIRSFNLNVFLFLALFIPEVGFYLFIDCPFRNLIAFGFALIAFRKLFENKKISFFIYLALALSFHLSAAILIVMFFLYKKDIKIYVVLIIAVIAYILAFNIDFLIEKIYLKISEASSLVDNRLKGYFLNTDFIATEVNKGAYIRIAILLILLLFKQTILSGDEKRQFVYNLAILSLLLYPFGVTMKIFHRLYIYLTPFYALSVIYLLNSFVLKSNRYIVYSFFVALSLLQTYVLVIYDHKYVPYSNYLHHWIKKDLPDFEYRSQFNKRNSPYRRPSTK